MIEKRVWEKMTNFLNKQRRSNLQILEYLKKKVKEGNKANTENYPLRKISWNKKKNFTLPIDPRLNAWIYYSEQPTPKHI